MAYDKLFMWLGHIFLPVIFWILTQRTLDLPLLLIGSIFPNVDSMPCHLGITRGNFHGGVIHTPFFIFLSSIQTCFIGFSIWLSFLFGGLMHLIGDVGCERGIMLLYPFNKKRFTVNMWRNTGIDSEIYRGLASDMVGYYSQEIPRIVELIVIITSFFLLLQLI
jgi:hypothetical protein